MEIYIKYIRRENIRNITPKKTNDFPLEAPVDPEINHEVLGNEFWGMLVWWLVSLEESQSRIPTHQIISFLKTYSCFYGALELLKHSPIHVLILILQTSPENRMLTPILEVRQ